MWKADSGREFKHPLVLRTSHQISYRIESAAKGADICACHHLARNMSIELDASACASSTLHARLSGRYNHSTPIVVLELLIQPSLVSMIICYFFVAC
eukprot:6185641-Pleurochrysis_carterae.AAC.1